MKITWFGATALRIYAGGSILVIDAEAAPGGIAPAELMAGADRVLSLSGDDFSTLDAFKWRARKPAAPINDVAQSMDVEIYRIGLGAVLVDAIGEPPLVVISDETPRFGRWADDAVVVLMGLGAGAAEAGFELVEASRPRLIALADSDAAVDAVVPVLRDRLDGAGLVALERGMAVEV